MKAREILLTLAIKNQGDWNKIYQDLQNKVCPTDEEEEQAQKLIQEKKINFLTILDENYPDNLKQSFKPPFVLFYYGDIGLLGNSNKIACLGSRDSDLYSNKGMEKYIDTECKDKTIISNNSHDIGQIVCNKAIKNNNDLIIVLPSGIDLCYPETNKLAYEKIKVGTKVNGLVISEYPSVVMPNTDTAIMRNRLIASIADKVFISNIKKQSGLNVVITNALCNGKDIEILPQPYTSELSNNELIADGATPVVF